MPVTLEARAIHLTDDANDIVVTSVHFPQYRKRRRDIALSRALDLPPDSILTTKDLSSFWHALPEHIQTDFPRGKNRPWLESGRELLYQSLKIQMLGGGLPALGSVYRRHIDIPFPGDPVSRILHWHYSNLSSDKGSPFERIGIRKVELCSSLILHLDGAFLGLDQLEQASGLLSRAEEYSIPICRSPGLEGITLKELAQKGTQAVCLFPLTAGIYAGIQHLNAEEFGIALQLTAVGGGMTIIAFSTLWIADRIFNNVKRLALDDDS